MAKERLILKLKEFKSRVGYTETREWREFVEEVRRQPISIRYDLALKAICHTIIHLIIELKDDAELWLTRQPDCKEFYLGSSLILDSACLGRSFVTEFIWKLYPITLYYTDNSGSGLMHYAAINQRGAATLKFAYSALKTERRYVDLEKREEYSGDTIFLSAVQSDNPENLIFLISVGADYQATNFLGQNALHLAVISRSFNTWKWLRGNTDLDPLAQDWRGESSIEYASSEFLAKIVEYDLILEDEALLLEAKRDTDSTIPHDAHELSDLGNTTVSDET